MNAFDYRRPTTVAEALRARASAPDARFLAGGTNLVDLMKYDVESPTLLIDVTRLPLARIEPLPNGGLRIGALVRNSDLAADAGVVRDYPVLARALEAGASPQLRNMATTGGNLLQRTRCYYFYDTAFACNKRVPGSGCSALEGHNRIHAVLGHSPACIAVHPSDMAVALAALDAVVEVRSERGAREIPIADFHRLPGDTPERDTNLAPDELIVSVVVPSAPVARRSTYVKVRDRASYAFALVSVAAALDVQGGVIRDARLALGGVAHKPWRVREAEAMLVGQAPDRGAFERAADRALQGARGFEHNTFKIELGKRSIVRAFETLTSTA